LIDRIDAAGLRVYQSGQSYMAQCPSHDDDSPSLRITGGRDGRALMYCIAGCKPAEIVGVLGMELKDLFQPGAQPLVPMQPRLVSVAGGGMATRAHREVIERETAALVRAWAGAYTPSAPPIPGEPGGRDWGRAWDIAAARSGMQR
jgi:hypothetical protein